MTRKQARESVFKLVFEIPFFGEDRYTERLDAFFNQLDDTQSPENIKYIYDVVNHCFENLDNIDKSISDNLKNWKLERLSKVDLSILRVAVTEILYIDSIPDKVSVNEAVNIAKTYGDDNSPSFINGVLSGVVNNGEL